MNGSYYASWCLLYFWPPNTENPFLRVKDVMLTVWWYVNLSPCKHEGDNLLQMRSKFRDRPTCFHHLLITGTLNFISNPSSRLPIHTEAVLDGLCVVKKAREDVKLTGECRWVWETLEGEVWVCVNLVKMHCDTCTEFPAKHIHLI